VRHETISHLGRIDQFIPLVADDERVEGFAWSVPTDYEFLGPIELVLKP